MSRIFAAFMLLFVAGNLTSCKHDPVELDPFPSPPLVSFSQDIVPIFSQHCSLAGCHSGSAPAGGLNLSPPTAYDALHQPGKGYIDTETPQYSLIYAQLNSSYLPMPPPPAAPIDSCRQQLLLKWIEQGALNN